VPAQENVALRAQSNRQSAVVAATIITVILVVALPSVASARAPRGLDRFKAAVGHVESGGRYTARNKTSGAYGKYQIMPANWPAWAMRYVGDAKARPTPHNQERVASGKMTSLYRWLGSWRRVAYWWLTGSEKRSGWSPAARRYVNKVMALYRHGAPRTHPRIRSATRIVNDRSPSIVYSGSWHIARHAGYRNDIVRYSTSRGAGASLTFTGRRVTWHGPVGPTRGRAAVYLDGRLVGTVDLRRGVFDPRATVFTKRWSKTGTHTIRIVVLGTRGRPMVAIDDFAIVR
jgi:hypothetical protein